MYRAASCFVCVPLGDSNDAVAAAMAMAASLIYLISLRSRSSFFFTRSFIRPFIHSGEHKEELVFRNPTCFGQFRR